MAETNFRCPKTGKEFFFAETKISYKAEGTIYKNKYGEQLVNPENGEVLEEIKRSRGLCTTFGNFASSSPSERKKILKARSHKHNQATTQKDEFHHKNITGTQKPKGIG